MANSRKNIGREREQFWQGHIESWKRDGISARQYCKRNGIKTSKFHYWKQKLEPQLRKESKQSIFANAPQIDRLSTEFPFVPVRLVEPHTCSDNRENCKSAQSNDYADQLEILTPRGYRVKVNPDTNLGLLSVLLSTLEYQQC